METLTTNALEDMDKSDLVTYANMTYGLNVNSRLSKQELIQQITKASQKFAGNAAVSLDTKTQLQPGFARIKINKTELNRRGRPVIISLNGKASSLPVGKEIIVPLSYVEILNNAVQFQYEPDPANDMELEKREVHSYPFSVLEMIPAEAK